MCHCHCQQEVEAEEEEEEEVVDCDVPSAMLSKGGQATSTSAHTSQETRGRRQQETVSAMNVVLGCDKSIEGKSTDESQHVTLDVTEDFTESELL